MSVTETTYQAQREARRMELRRFYVAHAEERAARAERSITCTRGWCSPEQESDTCAGREASGPLGCLCPCHDGKAT